MHHRNEQALVGSQPIDGRNRDPVQAAARKGGRSNKTPTKKTRSAFGDCRDLVPRCSEETAKDLFKKDEWEKSDGQFRRCIRCQNAKADLRDDSSSKRPWKQVKLSPAHARMRQCAIRDACNLAVSHAIL